MEPGLLLLSHAVVEGATDFEFVLPLGLHAIVDG